MRRVVVLLLSAVICFAATECIAQAGARQSDSTVVIESGKVKGTVNGSVLSFKGIPFAAAPVGNLRWRPPQAAKPWKGIRLADKYPSDCMQLPFASDAAPLGLPPSENCLYLNVWRPAAKTSSKLPVMVWIYGGGFVNGGTSPKVYDGSHFAEDGLVFVSFNYRLGRFGFFAHPALSREDPNGLLGNYGFMDQIAALKWVQRNITAFGGDPKNVTIFGESAGGFSVLTLLTSPMSRGLMQRAIIESGGSRDPAAARYLSVRSAEGNASAEEIGVAFASSLGITGADAKALEALRELPAEKLIAGMNLSSLGQNSTTYSGPMIDGNIVPELPDAAMAAGRFAQIPLMIGANSMDIGSRRGKSMDEILAVFGVNREKAKAVFDPDNSGDVRTVGYSISVGQTMIEPARFRAKTVSTSGLTSYEYRFSYVAESKRQEWRGAPHASEIPYVFNNMSAATYGGKVTARDESIAALVHAYWSAFAKTGNPNGPGRPEWPAYNPAKDMLMEFSSDGAKAMPDPLKPQLDLIEGAAQRQVSLPVDKGRAKSGK